MPKHLILSNNQLLLRITPDRIAYIASDGSYSVLKLTGGEEHIFSFNLSAFEKLIEQQLLADAGIFIRLGRSLIINSNYIYSININKQEVALSDTGFSDKFILSVPKDALKALKSVLENSICKKGEGYEKRKK